MTSSRLLMSLALALTLLTSLAEGACFQKPLSFNRSPEAVADGSGLALYCQYGEAQKPLFTAWVDLDSCVHCFCIPSGLRCCSLASGPSAAACQKRT